MKPSKLFVSMLFLTFTAVCSAGLIQAAEKRMCLKKRGKLLAGVFSSAISETCNGESGGSGGGSDGKGNDGSDSKGGTGK